MGKILPIAMLVAATAAPASAVDRRHPPFDPAHSYVDGVVAGLYDPWGFVYPADFGDGACGANADCSYPGPKPRLAGVPAAGYALTYRSHPYTVPYAVPAVPYAVPEAAPPAPYYVPGGYRPEAAGRRHRRGGRPAPSRSGGLLVEAAE